MIPFRTAGVTGLLLLSAVTAGCGNDVFGPSEERARAEAQALWQARPFTDYVIEARLDCQCPEVSLAWNRLDVRSGVITRVRSVATGEDLDAELFSLWLSVEQLFQRLRGPHPNSNVIDVRATYDQTLGFPSQADFIFSGILAEQSITYFFRNAGPLN